ncbi:hypothetical protein D3C71_1668690 [compost metagenome]
MKPKCTMGCRANSQCPSRQLTSTNSAPPVARAASLINVSCGLRPSFSGSTKPRANHSANHARATAVNALRQAGRRCSQRLSSHGSSGAMASTRPGSAGKIYSLRLPLLRLKNNSTSTTQPSSSRKRASRFCSCRRQAGTSQGRASTSGSQYFGMTLTKKYQNGSRWSQALA